MATLAAYFGGVLTRRGRPAFLATSSHLGKRLLSNDSGVCLSGKASLACMRCFVV